MTEWLLMLAIHLYGAALWPWAILDGRKEE